jgi:hypothetical protein
MPLDCDGGWETSQVCSGSTMPEIVVPVWLVDSREKKLVGVLCVVVVSFMFQFQLPFSAALSSFRPSLVG